MVTAMVKKEDRKGLSRGNWGYFGPGAPEVGGRQLPPLRFNILKTWGHRGGRLCLLKFVLQKYL